MTQAEYEAEMCFRLCKSIFSTLAAMGHISENTVRSFLRRKRESPPE